MKFYTRILNLTLLSMLVAAYVVMSTTHEFGELWPEDGKFQTQDAYLEGKPVNVPEWKASDSATGCKPEQFDGFQKVLVVTQGNDRVIMDFAPAWERTQDKEPANDIWVIGFC